MNEYPEVRRNCEQCGKEYWVRLNQWGNIALCRTCINGLKEFPLINRFQIEGREVKKNEDGDDVISALNFIINSK